MSERKVLNKYYPPDFNHEVLPRIKRGANPQYKVRMMLPMSVHCLKCGEFIYRGRKFNARKETVEGEDYMGLKIFRFYMRCPGCKNEFTLRTDLEKTDYKCELGVERNFETWKGKSKEREDAPEDGDEDNGTGEVDQGDDEVESDVDDAMKLLEKQTKKSKREIDTNDALENIRRVNARNSRVDMDLLSETRLKRKKQGDEEDEQIYNRMIELSKKGQSRQNGVVEEEEELEIIEPSTDAVPNGLFKKRKMETKGSKVDVIDSAAPPSVSGEKKPTIDKRNTATLMFGDYSSDESEKYNSS